MFKAEHVDYLDKIIHPLYCCDVMSHIEAYGTDRVQAKSVAELTEMFLGDPLPFVDDHGSGFADTVAEIYKNASEDLREKIHTATINSIIGWTPDTSGLQNIESLAVLSSFTENHAAVPELVRVVNEHRISGQDDASRLAEAKVVSGIWGLIPDPVAVEAFEAWWKEGNRDWMQTRAIFLGLIRANPKKIDEMFPVFLIEATQHENPEDIPLLVSLMTESVPPDVLETLLKKFELTEQFIQALPLAREILAQSRNES